jgi:valyl-tRNA synthetase
LLQPIVPFITETLWQRLPQTSAGAFIAQAAWPRPGFVATVPGGAFGGNAFELVRESVQAIRQIRSEYNVKPGAWIEASIVTSGEAAAGLAGQLETIRTMARANVAIVNATPEGIAARALMSGGNELVIPLAGLVDLDRERARLAAEIESLEKPLASLEGRLGNEKFLAKAPAELVEAERAKAAEWRTRLGGLKEKLRSLES